MMISKIALPRRTFLRGMGVTLALPLLDAMVPALTATAKTAANPIRRFGAVYAPNGMSMSYWTPVGEGRAFELSRLLQALAPFRDHLTVVSGLNGPKGASHAGGSTGFLTAMDTAIDTDLGKKGLSAGPSIDQLVAKEFGKHTQLASLELALDEATGTCDGNLSCVYTNTISWLTSTTPAPMEFNPRAVFERLFGDHGTTDPAARSARFKRDKSIVDSVIQEIAGLTRTVGPGDRAKLDEYVQAVRDIERRIQMAEAQRETDVPAMAQPPGIPATFAEHARLMYDLQAVAFQADLTRVTTFMLGRELTGRTYPEIGVPESHHPVSHHQNSPQKLALLAKINAFHMALFAEYLEKLQSMPDGDGSLLDHIIVLYGAGMSDSNGHVHDDLPLLLVGGGSGHLKGGRHLKYAGDPS
ncbi:MAG TPA: DUF1552 domain-containing protein, partial [Gemmataceae bacterium]|nr:DUF1552 domain-containing protein [Gemmataceae bacterium]